MTHEEVMLALKEENYRENVRLIDPLPGWGQFNGTAYKVALYVPEYDELKKPAFDYHGRPESGIVLDPRGHPEMAFPYIWSIDRFVYIPIPV